MNNQSWINVIIAVGIASFIAGYALAKYLYQQLLHEAQDNATAAVNQCKNLLDIISKIKQQ